MKPIQFLGFILAGLCLIVAIAMIFDNDSSTRPNTMGGGDSFGCYTSKQSYESPACKDIVQSNIDRLAAQRTSGALCRKDTRNWMCSGKAIVIIPHGDRFK